MGNARGLELPRRQACALQQRTRLVDPHTFERTSLPSGPKRSDRAAVTPCRESPGIAVRQRARPRAEQLGGVCGHRVAALDFLFVQSASAPGGRVVPHLLERPREIDSSRTRSGKQLGSFVEVIPARGRERERVGRCDTDRRRAPDRQLADRHDDLGNRPALELDLLVR